MHRIIFTLLTTIFLSLSAVVQVQATSSVTAYLFYGNGCPHCAKERDFLKKLDEKYPQLEVKEYEIYYNQKNNALLQKVATELKTEVGGVPFLVIGDKSYIGFAEGITSQEVESRIKECSDSACADSVASIVGQQVNPEAKPSVSPEPEKTEQLKTPVNTKTISVPIFGTVDTSKLSLPVLTFVLAFLDGFNPCAMWTLLFLISLLLGMKDRKRMWALGIAFIVSSAGVYFLFLSAWLNLFLFLGFIVWVRLLIGVVSLGAGAHYLRDYWVNKRGGCGVMGDEKRQRIFLKLQGITQKRQFLLALGGIILLAVAVNMVELICSAGLPAIYTQVLSLSNLPSWQYYLYFGLYILVFMLDDLFIFFTAMITLQAVGVQSKYSRYSHLIGGFLMLIIGLLLIFKPEWLMFG
jgi:glutaredoxin